MFDKSHKIDAFGLRNYSIIKKYADLSYFSEVSKM